MTVADNLRAFLIELALETPSTPAEALRIAVSLNVSERRLRFARHLYTTGRLSEETPLGLDENHLRFARYLVATGRLSDAR